MIAKPQMRCAIYTRKSSEEGLEQDFNSLHAQREACEAYILSQKSEGWIAMTQHYDDGGFSGGTLQRPAVQELLADIEAGRVDVVVVYKIDRLSRSLTDFARLVEIFERKAVTFVSVTQSFNTTTSMGRLTLNVLLSFAQFEREVTGERIRDKFAASKRKGMWMGGRPPLGYDIGNRRLEVNEVEAATVNLIFQRYLTLKSVRSLRDDLRDKNILAKDWTSSTSRQHGGKPFDRGALYCLLRNRTYVGETVHKGTVYAGEHRAIVARDLFDQIQYHLACSRRRQLGKISGVQDALLAGILFDEEGVAMTPTYSIKSGGRRYRYYVSRTLLRGVVSKASISRVPAPSLEDLVRGTLERLGLLPGHTTLNSVEDAIGVLRRVEIGPRSIAVRLDRPAALRVWRTTLPDIDGLNDSDLVANRRAYLGSGEVFHDQGENLNLMLPIRARFRGGRSSLVGSDTSTVLASQPDVALIKAIARAHQWNQMLVEGQIVSVGALAMRVKQERRHVGRTLNLAFLDPEITRAILHGRQPIGLRLSHLLDADIPLSWRRQREMIDQLAASNGSVSRPG